MDLVAMNSDGVVFALDAASGVTLWVTRTSATARVGVRAASNQFSPVLVPSAAGLDNVVVPFDGGVRAVQGATGKEMWRAPLPHSVTNGVALPLGNHTSALFLIDNTEPRLTVLDGSNGKVLAQSKLPARAFGLPVPLTYRGIQGVLIAFEDGRIEVRDKNATAVRAGNAGAAVTTPPLFVNGTRGLVLVGTRNGLTALDADDLRPLGRVVVKEDVPRGVLTAADLDGDGAPEVIMLTEGGQVVAVNAADGKIRWQQVGPVDAETATFVDLNADGALDVVVAGGQAFAIVLSGRDGSILWKAAEHPEFANHAASMAPRTLISSATGAGVLIVGSDPSGTNLRAVHLSSVAVQPINR